jgi:hypothetical protein
MSALAYNTTRPHIPADDKSTLARIDNGIHAMRFLLNVRHFPFILKNLNDVANN